LEPSQLVINKEDLNVEVKYTEKNFEDPRDISSKQAEKQEKEF
jgi:hypothetical protein